MFRKASFLKLMAVGAVAALVLAACGGDDDNETLTLSLSGVDKLANGYHYEGWAIIDGSPVSTGKFNVLENGALVDLDGDVVRHGAFDTDEDLTRATASVLTIEPPGDTDTIPSQTHNLAGSLSNLSASLTVGHAAALGNSFAGASGKYILATPTNGDDTNENSGIWFLDLSSGSPAQGLQLPTLPAGWVYEGWTVINGTPVTTGRFTDPAAADQAAPFSGPQPGPPFPGEDFLINAPAGAGSFPTDLSGATAVISIEPEPDDSGAPFTYKPLVAGIPDGAADHVTYDLDSNLGSFSSGTATLS